MNETTLTLHVIVITFELAVTLCEQLNILYNNITMF